MNFYNGLLPIIPTFFKKEDLQLRKFDQKVSFAIKFIYIWKKSDENNK